MDDRLWMIATALLWLVIAYRLGRRDGFERGRKSVNIEEEVARRLIEERRLHTAEIQARRPDFRPWTHAGAAIIASGAGDQAMPTHEQWAELFGGPSIDHR